ncbi:MAG: membrane protein insertase YidC [Nocardiopsaceae bacterium]|nr:membrane protein insertase YidC [Nocardiopsaceae bacterium]
MYTFAPIAAAIGVAYTVVTALTAVLAPIAGAASAAIAVVCLTAIVRTALIPLSYAQVRGEKARARLAPKLRELQRKYRGRPERLAAEQQRLFAEENTSPLAGCLPMLAQTPVFIALYGLFVSTTIEGAPNTLLMHSLGGVTLGSTLGDVLAAGFGPEVLVFVVLLVFIAGVAWASRQWLTLPALTAAADDRTSAVPGAMSYLSFLTVAIAAAVPLAAGLYLATSTAWTVAERLALRHFIAG